MKSSIFRIFHIARLIPEKLISSRYLTNLSDVTESYSHLRKGLVVDDECLHPRNIQHYLETSGCGQSSLVTKTTNGPLQLAWSTNT